MTPDPRVAPAHPTRAYPDPQAKEPPPRRWLVVLVLVWALVLVVGIGWALLHAQPTDREQTTVAQAQPVADAAAARIATAAGADGQAVSVLSGFERIGDCRVTVFRRGERYQRVVTVLVPAGTEQALMQRVAARLPASYGVTVEPGASPLLFGDAGDFVRLTGSVPQAGQVRFVADTGSCRPLGDVVPAGQSDGDRAPLNPVLGKLGVRAQSWYAYQVSCPGGGTLSTVEAIGPDGVVAGASDLRLALAGLGTPVVSAPETYAYLTGSNGIAVRVDNRHLVISATTVACG